MPMKTRSKSVLQKRQALDLVVIIEPTVAASDIPILNDDCTLVLLRQLSLQELIPLRVVCRGWWDIIEKYIFRGNTKLQLCQTSKFLLLNPVYQSYDHYYGWEYSLPGHTKHLVCIPKYGALPFRFLARIFPNITSLTVYHSPHEPKHMLALLQKWPALSTLVIHRMRYGDVSCTRLWKVIKEMTSLRHLALFDFSGYKNPSGYIPSLPQLEQLTVYLCHRYFLLATVLDGFASLTRLNLHEVTCYYEEFTTAINKYPLLKTQLTHLTISLKAHPHPIEDAFITLICDNLSGLTYFELTFGKTDIYHLMKNLFKLKNLTELRLRSTCYFQYHRRFVREAPTLIENHEEIDYDRLFILKSLKTLHLHIWLKLEHIAIYQSVFPAVHSFYLNHKRIECSCSNSSNGIDEESLIGQDLYYPVVPSRNCPDCVQSAIDRFKKNWPQLGQFVTSFDPRTQEEMITTVI